MNWLIIKSLHIIFVITWFSGMFYLVRLFIYYREAMDRPQNEREILLTQFQLMAKRLLYGITWPSAILTLILGNILLYSYSTIPSWMWWKIGFVFILFSYHFSLEYLYRNQHKGLFTSQKLRLWNELPTVLLFAIVFLVVLKQTWGWVYGLTGIGGLSLLLLMGIRWYKKWRTQQ